MVTRSPSFRFDLIKNNNIMWLSQSPLRVLTLAGLVAFSPTLRADLNVGSSLPNLDQYSLEGNRPDLRNKVVLIDVWASWCAPCKASFPELDKMHQDLSGDGLVILGVSADQKASAYRKFLQHNQPQFSTLRDQDQQLIAELGPPTMPTSFLFGRDGRLRSIHRGFHGERSVQELRQEIQTLLQESR